jgi:hypothetical protein
LRSSIVVAAIAAPRFDDAATPPITQHSGEAERVAPAASELEAEEEESDDAGDICEGSSIVLTAARAARPRSSSPPVFRIDDDELLRRFR